MLEELEILELRHKYLTMLRTKKLKNLGIKGIGEEIFARYGFSFMEVEICNEKINIPMLTEIQTMVLNSPFKLKAKKGGKENLHRKSNGINSKKCYLSHNNPT